MSAKFNPVTIAILITMLTLEGRRITSKNLSITVGNEFEISNGHQIIMLAEFNEIFRDELLATRAIDFVVKSSLNLFSLRIIIILKNAKKTLENIVVSH